MNQMEYLEGLDLWTDDQLRRFLELNNREFDIYYYPNNFARAANLINESHDVRVNDDMYYLISDNKIRILPVPLTYHLCYQILTRNINSDYIQVYGNELMMDRIPYIITTDRDILRIIRSAHYNANITSLTLSHRANNQGLMAHIIELLANNEIQIQNLFIEEGHLTDESGIALMDALRTNTRITHLYLYSNLLTDNTLRALVPVIEQNNQLQVINLTRNRFTNDGVRELLVALRHNFTLGELHIENDGIDLELISDINRTVEQRQMRYQRSLAPRPIGYTIKPARHR